MRVLCSNRNITHVFVQALSLGIYEEQRLLERARLLHAFFMQSKIRYLESRNIFINNKFNQAETHVYGLRIKTPEQLGLLFYF